MEFTALNGFIPQYLHIKIGLILLKTLIQIVFVPITFCVLVPEMLSYTTSGLFVDKNLIIVRQIVCDWILENRSKLHIWYFEKYQFQVFTALYFSGA